MTDKSNKSYGALELERAKVEAELAKKRLSGTMHELQQRLRPGALANQAWSGVKDKGGDIADTTMQAVKDRPLTVSGVVAGLVVFIARHPLGRLATRLFGHRDEDLVTTRVTKKDENYDLAAPAVSRSIDEGVSA